MPRCSYLPILCITNYQYNFGVEGQGQIKTKSVIRLITRTPISCLRARVFIYGTMIEYGAWFLITALLLVSKDEVKYLYNQFMACCPSLFDQGCSYFAQLLLMVCNYKVRYISPIWPWSQGLIRICLTVACF